MDISPQDPNILFSPYNWHITPEAATTLNPGAYFRFLTDGFVKGGVSLVFDISAMRSGHDSTIISYSVNGQPRRDVALASYSGANPGLYVLELALPLEEMRLFPRHSVEVWVKATSGGRDIVRWGRPSNVATILKKIVLPDAALLFALPSYPLKAACFGDSITEGFATLAPLNAGAVYGDHSGGYAHHFFTGLGAEYGNCAFAGTGVTTGDTVTAPPVGEALAYIMPGVARDLSDCDLILLNSGTNDYVTPEVFVPRATELLSAMLEAAPRAQIVVLRPFNGSHAVEWELIVLKKQSPRLLYIDTTGFYQEPADGPIHPPASLARTVIAPKLLAAYHRALAMRQPAACGCCAPAP